MVEEEGLAARQMEAVATGQTDENPNFFEVAGKAEEIPLHTTLA